MNRTKTFLVLLIAIAGVFSFVVSPVFGSEEQPTTIVLPKDQTINKDYFAAGDTVTLSGTVNGDAYVAGGNVIIEGVVNGDLLAAGGTINIRGNVSQDVRVAGGQIIITGTVGRNLTTVGGSVTIVDSAKINGSLTAGTGSLQVFAPIGKEANFGAGQVTIGNTINGDVQAGVGQLTLTPNASISGNLTYWSETKAELGSSSQVTGKITQNILPEPIKEQRDLAQKKAVFNPVFNVISFLAALLVGLLLTSLAPNYLVKTTNTLLHKPFQSLGIGFLSMIVAPFLFILLLITIIGIPLDLMILAGFLILIYLAKIVVSLAIGQKILTTFNKKTALGWTFLVGLVIYYILTMIPVLGFVFWMIAGLMGLGALLIEKKQIYQDLRLKKLI